MYGLYGDLTRDYILERVTQEKIFERFMFLYTKQEFTVNVDAYYLSPFRANDNRPSCNFTINANGKLRFRDWGGGFYGDCFDFVAYWNGLNPRNRRDFMTTLHIIAKEFSLHAYSDGEEHYQPENRTIVVSAHGETNRRKRLQVIPRDWHPLDGKYWFTGDVRMPELREGNVVPVEYLWVDDKLYYFFNPTRNPNDLAYGYFQEPSQEDIDAGKVVEPQWRVYFPGRERVRFIANHSRPQGLHTLRPGPFLVITKSLKDAIALRRYKIRGHRIQSIAPHSESTHITHKEFYDIKRKYGFVLVFTLFDYDPAGLKATIHYRRNFNTIPLLIKNPTWNSGIKYKVKDFFDYRVEHGVDKSFKLVKDTEALFAQQIERALNPTDDIPF